MDNEQETTKEQETTQNTESQGQSQTTENQGDGNQSQEPEVVKQVNKARESMAKENERIEKNLKELKELYAKKALGGKSQNQQQQKQEISDEEYAQKALKGELDTDPSKQ